MANLLATHPYRPQKDRKLDKTNARSPGIIRTDSRKYLSGKSSSHNLTTNIIVLEINIVAEKTKLIERNII